MRFRNIHNKIKLYYYNRKWRKSNSHNDTSMNRIFDYSKVKVGRYTYGALNVYTWEDEKEKLIIGNFVSIATDVKFILGGNHNYNTLSTYPYRTKILGEKDEAWSKGPIIIDDDVWIGMNVTILSGVKIGKGAVIATGSVVTKDVAPYSIVGGNPAKIIKYRFSEELIKEVEKVKLSDLNKEDIIENIENFYTIVNEELLTKINFTNKK